MNPIFTSAGLMVLIGAAPATIALAPRSDAPVIIVSAPWAAPDAAIQAALATPGALLWAAPDGRRAILLPRAPDAPAHLYRAGAMLVLRADASALCAGDGELPPSPLATPLPERT